ncbi:hypothetical protein POPTR_007G060500v4 [Populus trichocarpa]|uniref:Uncharacterized protein n=1 Tax=Populus trichocarpa TaxID=3694 RepID=A0A3N7F7S1_POPTR|nr:hypothetical protein POPTR_007G060500v4 [Populus trichocarpa]
MARKGISELVRRSSQKLSPVISYKHHSQFQCLLKTLISIASPPSKRELTIEGTAAITIQANFRGHLVSCKTGISSTPEPGEIASVKRSSGCRYRFEQGRTSSYLRSKLISLYNSRRVL